LRKSLSYLIRRSLKEASGFATFAHRSADETVQRNVLENTREGFDAGLVIGPLLVILAAMAVFSFFSSCAVDGERIL
jgi:hypothetical protein